MNSKDYHGINALCLLLYVGITPELTDRDNHSTIRQELAYLYSTNTEVLLDKRGSEAYNEPMKLKLPNLSKKQFAIAGAVVALSTAGVTAALNQPQKTGADTSPIVQQVQHNTDQLGNHEARISNAENNIKDLQNNTGTPASPSNVSVPAVTTPAASTPIDTPAPTPTPTPQPVTVTQVGIYSNVMGDTHCILYYSDGSQGTSPIDQQGNCSSYIGQAK